MVLSRAHKLTSHILCENWAALQLPLLLLQTPQQKGPSLILGMTGQPQFLPQAQAASVDLNPKEASNVCSRRSLKASQEGE